MLEKLRERIDKIDAQIAHLLDLRLETVIQISKMKESQKLPVFDPIRENEVLKNVTEHSSHKESMISIYHAILNESKEEQNYRRFNNCPFKNIGIVGLGLMGGSLYRALKDKEPFLYLETMNEDGDIAKLVDNCDLIILASPLETVVPYAEQIAKLHNGSKPLYVIDIASVKNTILPVFKKLSSDNLHFISTHPIAGKEISGYENSDPFLFVNRPWWIFEESPLIEDFIHFVGAIPIHISGEQHDKYAALVSHLPILLSYSYYHFVMRQNKESLEMSGPSFASFTRLAHENPALMKEIFKNNHKTLHDLLGKWVKYLKDIE